MFRKTGFQLQRHTKNVFWPTVSDSTARRPVQVSGISGNITQAITPASSLQRLTNCHRPEFLLRAKDFYHSKDILPVFLIHQGLYSGFFLVPLVENSSSLARMSVMKCLFCSASIKEPHHVFHKQFSKNIL